MSDRVSIGEIESKLEEILAEDSKYGFSFIDFLTGDYDEDVAKEAGIVWIEQHGGGEGGSEHCETIFSIGDVTYKVVYSYYSHHGYEMNGASAYIVTPVQKLVTVYE